MPPIITQKEAKLLKWYFKFPWHFVSVLIVLIATAAFFYYLIAIWGESKIVSIFISTEEPCPGIQSYVKGLFDDIMSAFFQPTFLFFSISVGLIIASIFNHLRLSKLFKKIDILKMVEIEGPDNNDQ